MEDLKFKDFKEEKINNLSNYIEEGLKAGYVGKDFKRLNLLIDIALSRPYSTEEEFSSEIIKFLKKSKLERNKLKILADEANKDVKLFINAFDRVANSNVEYITASVISWNLHLKNKSKQQLDLGRIYEISRTPQDLIKNLDPKIDFGILMPIASLYDKNLMDTISSKYRSLGLIDSIDKALELGIITTKYSYLNRVRVGPNEPDFESTISKKKHLYSYIKELLPKVLHDFKDQKKFLLPNQNKKQVPLFDAEKDLERKLDDHSIYNADIARKQAIDDAIRSKDIFEFIDNLDYILIADFYRMKELSDTMEDLDEDIEKELLRENAVDVIRTTYYDLNRAIDNLNAISSYHLIRKE